MGNLYNIGEASEILGVSQKTLRRWDYFNSQREYFDWTFHCKKKP
ncbi:MAG: MerR family transcriptional regulator [Bacteroidales bacterium]|jgi:hypothetical protein|nr:MerR family transcriptional regulator [Bacteroidales bacterium]